MERKSCLTQQLPNKRGNGKSLNVSIRTANSWPAAGGGGNAAGIDGRIIRKNLGKFKIPPYLHACLDLVFGNSVL